MPRKKNPPPVPGRKFVGVLNEPIVRPKIKLKDLMSSDPAIQEQVYSDSSGKTIRIKQLLKMEALLEQYGITATDSFRWFLLAYYMATDFVRGMQVVDQMPRVGRPTQWTLDQQMKLYMDVKHYLIIKGGTAKNAVRQLQKRSEYKTRSVDALYFQFKQTKRELAPILKPVSKSK